MIESNATTRKSRKIRITPSRLAILEGVPTVILSLTGDDPRHLLAANGCRQPGREFVLANWQRELHGVAFLSNFPSEKRRFV